MSPTHRTLTTVFNNQPAKVAPVGRQLPRADTFPISFEGEEPLDDLLTETQARHQRMATSLLMVGYFCLGLLAGLAVLYRFFN